MEPYDDLLLDILKSGELVHNRTGVDTLSVFGRQLRFNISKYFPIVTGRKIYSKAGFAELLWMLSGSTQNKDLENLGAKFWKNWTSTEWANSHGFVDDALGPIYGFQMRHFDGEYCAGDTQNPDYGKGGVDQLEYIVDRIKNNPDCRRILWSFWNPRQNNQMRLMPCHVLFQVRIYNDKMSGQVYIRSNDTPVGACFNIFWYAALIYLLAKTTGYEPSELVYTVGDAHIYVDQIQSVEEYLFRPKPDSPRLVLPKKDHILDYTMEDFRLLDYNPLKPIKLPVAV